MAIVTMMSIGMRGILFFQKCCRKLLKITTLITAFTTEMYRSKVVPEGKSLTGFFCVALSKSLNCRVLLVFFLKNMIV